MSTKIKKLLELFKYTFSRLTGRGYHMFPNGLNRTAAKATQGFWYVGDIGAANDIAHGVLVNGVAEPESEKVVLDFLSSCNKDSIGFYDIGANTGYFAILAAFVNKKVASYGFEPVPEFCKTAKLSVDINKLNNCHIFNYAVGNEEKEADFFFSGTGTSLIPNFGRKDTVSPRKIQEIKLDNFIKQNNLVPPDFIMIDVEGFEMQVLLGTQEMIKVHHPVIYFECQAYSESKNEVLSLLKKWGYAIKQIDEIMFFAKVS